MSCTLTFLLLVVSVSQFTEGRKLKVGQRFTIPEERKLSQAYQVILLPRRRQPSDVYLTPAGENRFLTFYPATGSSSRSRQKWNNQPRELYGTDQRSENLLARLSQAQRDLNLDIHTAVQMGSEPSREVATARQQAAYLENTAEVAPPQQGSHTYVQNQPNVATVPQQGHSYVENSANFVAAPSQQTTRYLENPAKSYYAPSQPLSGSGTYYFTGPPSTSTSGFFLQQPTVQDFQTSKSINAAETSYQYIYPTQPMPQLSSRDYAVQKALAAFAANPQKYFGGSNSVKSYMLLYPKSYDIAAAGKTGTISSYAVEKPLAPGFFYNANSAGDLQSLQMPQNMAFPRYTAGTREEPIQILNLKPRAGLLLRPSLVNRLAYLRAYGRNKAG